VVRAWLALETGSTRPPVPGGTLPGFAPARDEVEAIYCLADGEHRDALARFECTAAGWRAGSDRRGVLRCGWGAALAADRAGLADAIDRLHASWMDATRHGCAPIAARARAALRTHGVRTEPFPAVAEAPLSAAETQTLRLVAAGFTTPQVAAMLGIQAATIGDHLQSAIQRLGLQHRMEAVRWMADRP
jgi:DNA-binding NarL/FixJ family response regulator